MNKTVVIVILSIVIIGSSSIQDSSQAGENWPCEALLCLSNPGGARQYAECNPPINKLERWLFNRRPFPKCHVTQASGLGVKQGYERYVSCAESYGPGYNPVTVEECRENCVEQQICRKVIASYEFVECDEVTGDCQSRVVKDYDDQPQIQRHKPYYVQIQMDGKQTGRRYYYKIKKKKKGLF